MTPVSSQFAAVRLGLLAFIQVRTKLTVVLVISNNFSLRSLGRLWCL